jgi:hypothetical protein
VPLLQLVLARLTRNQQIATPAGHWSDPIRGALATLGSGNERRRLTQRWARAIYEDSPAARGVAYLYGPPHSAQPRPR